MTNEAAIEQAHQFLAGQKVKFDKLDETWRRLKKIDKLSLARRVLEQMRKKPDYVMGGVPDDEVKGVPIPHILCREEALLTSKDPELSANMRHDEALKLLEDEFKLSNTEEIVNGDTLGIAGGICKRRWKDLGQLKDLIAAANFYERGSKCYGPPDNPLGSDGYPHINQAFVEDLLAEAGDHPDERRKTADALRNDILKHLKPERDWFNRATHVEALFGLGEYKEATKVLKGITDIKPEPWQLRTTAEQLVHLAHLHEDNPLAKEDIRTFFETLLPGAGDALRAVIIGKVGLALSGGGFRASFYHLGVLACLAERDILRDIEVLSCVSGGSIVAACYWLKLRQRLMRSPVPTQKEYVQLVCELIDHFKKAVEGDPRRQIQPSTIKAIWKVAQGAKGLLDPEDIAGALEEHFYRPLWDSPGASTAAPIYMHELKFTPKDHNPALSGPDQFNPGKHNWLRAHKVPALILNATTVNTGHAWHFTPTWMGESPWAIHAAADSVPRLEWCEYDPIVKWQMELRRAVAASACVPLVFEPLRMRAAYDDVEVSLVDGGVYDNQGTVALLASDCNVILVSDACGQLVLERAPPTGITGAARAAKRSMDTLMERVRLANFADLAARRRSGLLRGLMFLHMKAGLESDVIHLPFSQESYALEHTPLTPLGVRREFQQAVAELRTDLDAFTPDESAALMACGYKMASNALDDQLPDLAHVWQPDKYADWPFSDMLKEIESTARGTERRKAVLRALQTGNKVKI